MKIASNAQMRKGPPFLEALFSYRLARLAGFEPTTPWFVAKYSIQLSYSRNREKRLYRSFQFCEPPSCIFFM